MHMTGGKALIKSIQDIQCGQGIKDIILNDYPKAFVFL